MELWIHVDLKCLVPTSATLMRHISGWAAEGATGIVFEWENMFPYSGFDKAVRKDAYERKEITAILEHCRTLGLTAIPLVQTFGHVEWLLSHPSYASLREFEKSPSQIRACDEKSYAVLKSLIADLIAVHHDSPYIHLGADETFALADIDRPDCSSKREGAAAVFLRHMTPLFQQVVAAGKRPIIWADMVLAHPESLDEFPRELVFCDWLYHQTSEYGLNAHGWGMRGSEACINASNYDAVPAEKKKYFEKYWRGDAADFPARFYQFPYLCFLRDRGFDVIGASATMYSGQSLAGPRLVEMRANERGWLNATHRFGGLGVVNTCWAVRGALRETTLTGHRAFLIQGRNAAAMPEDALVAEQCWRAIAGDKAGQVARAVDRLAPPGGTLACTAPLFFDAATCTTRPKPFDGRFAALMEETKIVSDDDPLVVKYAEAREHAIEAKAALAFLPDDNEETVAWRLGAEETDIRAALWLAARQRVLGRETLDLSELSGRIQVQSVALAGFMKGRYQSAEATTLCADRYEGLLRLLGLLAGV